MTGLRLAAKGSLSSLDHAALRSLLERDTAADPAVSARTAAIIDRVRRDGDAALRALALELDGIASLAIEVPRGECDEALASLDPGVRTALERAAANIHAVHAAFRPASSQVMTADGVVVTRRPDPLQRVGVYAPGGRAAYPSSLLMGAIPARVAGVPEVLVCSPPVRDGRPSSVVLAAASLAGVDRVFAIGGAGAIAAMAHGTGTVPRVDRIVGPGNAFVAEAKIQLSTIVGVDSPAGPSELLVLADGTPEPGRLASELLAQAEHDPRASVVLIALSPEVADAVRSELARRILGQPREAVVRASLASRGGVLDARSLDEAIAFVERFAPEHLLLALAEPGIAAALPRIRGAGTILLGASSSVAFGDYLTGANHVLPTGGWARTRSGLSTVDFVRWTTTQRVDRDAAARLARDTARLADAEGLPAHADAARAWEAA
jgi:histidinol dehydrogenase